MIYLLLLVWTSSCDGENTLSPGGKPMLFVGVYQEGLTASSYCQSAIKKSYERKEKFWKFMMEKGNFKIDDLMNVDDFTYTEKTFSSVDQLVNIIIDLKLNQSYFVDNEFEQDPTWNKKKIKSWRTTSRLMIMFLYADEQKSQIARKLLYGEDYVVILLNQKNIEIIEDKNIYSTKGFLDNNAKELMTQIVNRIKYSHVPISIGINYFLVVVIKGNDIIYNIEFEYFYNHYVMKYYKEYKRCHILYRLNISDNADINNFVNHLLNDKFIQVVIVFGDPEDQIYLYDHYLTHPKKKTNNFTTTWIFHDLRKNDFMTNFLFYSGNVFSFVVENYKYKSPENFNDILEFIKMDSGGMTADISLQETAAIRACSTAYENQILRMVMIIHLFHSIDYFKGKKSLKAYKFHCLNRIKKQSGNNNRIMFRILSDGITNSQEQEIRDRIKGISSKCPIPYCGPGKERYFGEITENVFLRNNSFGWACKQCDVEHVKYINSLDNSTCTRCPTLMVPTKDQSDCFDPYTNIFIEFKDATGLITLGICGSGFIFSIINLMVLYKHRETPFVKAFDLPKLVQHLLFMIFSFGFYPYLFIGKPSPVKCFLQPVSVLILSICPSIIILLKSQNVLLIFKSKLRLSKGEKMRSTAWQIMIASLIIVIDVSLLCLKMERGLPSIIRTYNHILHTRHIQCNNGGDINIQIAYLITLELLTSVQAFRGRNLPGAFNEGLTIAYSTFVLVITQTVQFPIYYLQQDVKVRSSVHAVILSASHLLFILIYYGSKLYLLIFKRNENTREYFRAQRMKDM